MPEIEFLESGGQAPEPEPGSLETRAGSLGFVPAALALAGAALAIWAPFLRVGDVREPVGGLDLLSTDPGGNGPVHYAHLFYDGWGRDRASGQDFIASGHGVRYGIVLVAVCGLFVLAAVCLALGARPGPTPSRHAINVHQVVLLGRTLALGASLCAAAMSATVYLSYLSFRDNIAPQLQPISDSAGSYRVTAGPCWIAAGACAGTGLLAVGASLAFASRSRSAAGPF